MKLKTFKDEGVVLSRKSVGEADRLITIYTKNFGRLTLLAKGVRKLTSRKRGHIEVFSHIYFAGSKGNSIDLMVEVQNVRNFNKIRQDLKKTSVAYFIVETTEKLTRDLTKNEELFDLLLKTLRTLEDTEKTRELRENFIQKILTLLGFWPATAKLANPDRVLEEVIEKELSSYRVGKKLLKN